MNKQNLPKVVARRKKRLGHGIGSGKGGHTSSRGQKGQKARTSVGILFEGLKVKKSLLHRLPVLRGKGKFSPNPKPLIITLDALNLLPANSKVDMDTLVKAGILREKDKKESVKILGNGKLTKKLNVALPISKSAAKMVEKAGGKIV